MTCVLNKLSVHETWTAEIIDFWHFVRSLIFHCCLQLLMAPAPIIKIVLSNEICSASSRMCFGPCFAHRLQSISQCVILSTYVNCLFMSKLIFSLERSTQMSFKLTLSHEIRCSINYRTRNERKKTMSLFNPLLGDVIKRQQIESGRCDKAAQSSPWTVSP